MALGRFERSVLGRRWRVGRYAVASSRPRLNLEALGGDRPTFDTLNENVRSRSGHSLLGNGQVKLPPATGRHQSQRN